MKLTTLSTITTYTLEANSMVMEVVGYPLSEDWIAEDEADHDLLMANPAFTMVENDYDSFDVFYTGELYSCKHGDEVQHNTDENTVECDLYLQIPNAGNGHISEIHVDGDLYEAFRDTFLESFSESNASWLYLVRDRSEYLKPLATK